MYVYNHSNYLYSSNNKIDLNIHCKNIILKYPELDVRNSLIVESHQPVKDKKVFFVAPELRKIHSWVKFRRVRTCSRVSDFHFLFFLRKTHGSFIIQLSVACYYMQDLIFALEAQLDLIIWYSHPAHYSCHETNKMTYGRPYYKMLW